MSKLYYDHLVILEDVEIELNQMGLDRSERAEIEDLIEETIHHRVLERVLQHLPQEHHEEFLGKFTKAPHDPSLIRYLDQKIEASVERHIKDEMEKLKKELLEDIRTSKKSK
jgi:hypothetical protein